MDTDEGIKTLREMAKVFRDIADQSERAADALENIKNKTCTCRCEQDGAGQTQSPLEQVKKNNVREELRKEARLRQRASHPGDEIK